ncbi:uncharacterized protein LOC110685845 isoform X1 [Chenopodium quinoa]|uniref:uncharacterized protein LOC110685845 isoform X1 n=1 Tax=Chenopodium quinoa TaxID=63459 RepID=UPI000B786EB1|nr:uncharacterized protein LOC110685845 isoform X1 [Chenopodium quinoa]XP_021718071.1 uncharacterized protein LOC110685845 isoform X1 [Chenopodium quinoa]
MLSSGNGFDCINAPRLIMLATLVVLSWVVGVASVAVPSSNCYALDNSSHIVDFTSWKGHLFEYEGKESDLVVRFCKDVESRSQTGYVDFGRFDTYNHFVAGSGRVNFVQGFYEGDLMNCEQSYNKLGRTAQVNIICGSCLSRQCKGELGCICSVTYESSCRVIVELAIPCEKRGPRVFEGFTIGFHPRSWEIVYNGMTQPGFEKSHNEYRFSTEQIRVTLHMTAVASLSNLVQKPTVKVLPRTGLEVHLSGSGASGTPPTTLSPTVLTVDWTCKKVHTTPYEVEITIPVENYDPVKFTLTKMCDHKQDDGKETMKGWAIFGILSCIFFVSLTLFCCGGFIYKSGAQNQHGLDALPGMTYLSAFLQTVSGGGQGYQRAEESNNPFIPAAQGAGRTEVRYGSI